MKDKRYCVVRMALLKKKSDLDLEGFRRHWYGTHANLAAGLSGLQAYIQNRVVDHRQIGTDLPRGKEEYDGFAQLWFEDIKAMRTAISGLSQSLSADEVQFLDDLRIVILHQYETVAPVRNGHLVKQLSLLRRRANVSAEQFAAEWTAANATLVSALPGIRGFRQSLIVEREAPKNNPVGYDRLPLDAVSEIWFDTIDSLEAAFASVKDKLRSAQSPSLLAEATTFLVEERIVVS